MCVLGILVGAALITGVTTFIASARDEAAHVGPMMSGAVCALVIVPQAMLTGPLVAILGLPVTLIVGGLAGEPEQQQIIGRAILGGIGFLVATVLVVILTGGGADGPGALVIFPQLLHGVLSVFGIQCG